MAALDFHVPACLFNIAPQPGEAVSDFHRVGPNGHIIMLKRKHGTLKASTKYPYTIETEGFQPFVEFRDVSGGEIHPYFGQENFCSLLLPLPLGWHPPIDEEIMCPSWMSMARGSLFGAWKCP